VAGGTAKVAGSKPKKHTAQKLGKDKDNFARHMGKCGVCKSPHRKEIEEMYLDGDSPYAIAPQFKVQVNAIYVHAKVFKLDDKRDHSTLRQCRRIIDKANISKRKISDPLVAKAMELAAKITGELRERHEAHIDADIRMSIEQITNARTKNFIESVGGTVKMVEDFTDDEPEELSE
jgi:hypothetical protein